MLRFFSKAIAVLGASAFILMSISVVTAKAIEEVEKQSKVLEDVKFVLAKENLHQVLPILLAFILVGIVIYYAPKWFYHFKVVLNGILVNAGLSKKTDYNRLDKEIKTVGYRYDPKQDIFYSTMNAWQRKFGYCRLYDEATAPTGMIIDCEPIYFEYGGKRWMIELWKGQYDLTTGGEMGVYNTEGPDLNIPGVFNGTFYKCVNNNERLQMSFILKKHGKILFKREGRHWWLTGFKLGEFSEPSELSMDISITLKDKIMRNAFLKGLKNIGYSNDEITVNGNTVSFNFDKPNTPQPITRTTATDWLIQRKNEQLCAAYQDITRTDNNTLDKMKTIQQKSPKMYKEIMNIGKTKPLFEKYEIIEKHLN